MTWDTFNYWYYLIHIPITIIMDSTIVVPPKFNFQTFLIQFHINQNKDFLMVLKPLWFQTFVWVELLFQLPFFFAALYMISTQCPTRHLWNMIYGFNASFTTLVCIVHYVAIGPDQGLTQKEVIQLVSIYLPYLLIPLGIMIGSYIQLSSQLKEPKAKVN